VVGSRGPKLWSTLAGCPPFFVPKYLEAKFFTVEESSVCVGNIRPGGPHPRFRKTVQIEYVDSSDGCTQHKVINSRPSLGPAALAYRLLGFPLTL
jgi:hypothetical protein